MSFPISPMFRAQMEPGTFANVAGHVYRETKHPGPHLWRYQRFLSEWRNFPGAPIGSAQIRFAASYDDTPENRKHHFSLTSEVKNRHTRGAEFDMASDSVVADVFPEVSGLIPFIGMTSAGPVHYLENTLYLAGNRDHYGLLLGESRPLFSAGVPLWSLAAFTSSGQQAKFPGSFSRHHTGTVPPVPLLLRWVPATQIGEGKPRELAAARSVATWPDATDAELSAEPAELKAALLARLPELLAQFRKEITSAGFVWSPSDGA